MTICCCILRGDAEAIDRQVLSNLLNKLAPQHPGPVFSGSSEDKFGLKWQGQFFVITHRLHPIPNEHLEPLAVTDLTDEIRRHRSHWIVCHIDGSGEAILQAQIFTHVLSALSAYGVAVMWRDLTLSSSSDWQEHTRNGMDLSQWIAVLKTEAEGDEWIRTYGLDFFGRPEIAVRIGSNTIDITIDYLKSIAEFLLENTIDFVENRRIVGHPASFDVERILAHEGAATLVYLSPAL